MATGKTLEDFGKLSAPEQALVEACRKGELCELGDGTRPEGPDKSREIGAELLGFLILGGGEDCHTHTSGVQLKGAYVTGALTLDFGRAVGITGLINCHFSEEISVPQTRFELLNLRGSVCPGLLAQGVEVTGNVMLHDGFHAIGAVNLSGAKIGGQLTCQGSRFENSEGRAFHAQRLRVSESFLWRNVTVATGAVDLTSAHVGDLVDDLESWPEGENRLCLDGFTYDKIAGSFTDAPSRLEWLARGTVWNGEFHPQPYGQLARVLRAMGHDGAARRVRMAALQNASFHQRSLDRSARKFVRAARRLSGKYASDNQSAWQELFMQRPRPLRERTQRARDHFIRLYSVPPAPKGAPPPLAPDILAFAQLDFRNQMRTEAFWCRLRIAGSWLGDIFMRLVIGYGYAPWRAAFWGMACVTIASIVFSYAYAQGAMVPNSTVILTSLDWWRAMWSAPEAPTKVWSQLGSAKHYETFYAIAYAFDVFIPIVDLGQQSAWAATTVSTLGFATRWFTFGLEIVGWIVSALAAAALTGLIQRKDD